MKFSLRITDSFANILGGEVGIIVVGGKFYEYYIVFYVSSLSPR